jgi:hypothetical protein
MKPICFRLAMLLLAVPATGWTQYEWRHGDKTTNVAGVYGTQGLFAPSNKPGARWGATTWKDQNGNFWLFGGEGYGATGSSGLLSDLWKYNPSTNQWMWVKGPTTRNIGGTYGTKGVAHSANNPGGREVAIQWMDNTGNLWIFGGYGYDGSGSIGFLNDLWKYDPVTNQWTWMSGDNTGYVNGVATSMTCGGTICPPGSGAGSAATRNPMPPEAMAPGVWPRRPTNPEGGCIPPVGRTTTATSGYSVDTERPAARATAT